MGGYADIKYKRESNRLIDTYYTNYTIHKMTSNANATTRHRLSRSFLATHHLILHKHAAINPVKGTADTEEHAAIQAQHGRREGAVHAQQLPLDRAPDPISFLCDIPNQSTPL